MSRDNRDPFAGHLRVLRAAIRAQHDWRGGQDPDDWPEWNAQKRQNYLALRNLHQFALIGVAAKRAKKKKT